MCVCVCVCVCMYVCDCISLYASFDGSNFMVNCSDRVLRVYDLEQVEGGKNGADRVDSDGDDEEGEGEVEALQRLQDLVNR